MLYVNLLDDGSHQVMQRVTKKGNAYLVPFANNPDNPNKVQEVDENKKWVKKIFAYLRLPPISATTREKLFHVRTGEPNTDSVKEWLFKINRQEQGLYVAVEATYPPRLFFNLKHLGDPLSDEKLQELMDAGGSTGPDGEEILASWDWNLMSDSPSAIATLLDPIYVQMDEDAEHVQHMEENQKFQAAQDAKVQELKEEQRRNEMSKKLEQMREELDIQEQFVAKEKGQEVSSSSTDSGEPWITYNEEAGKEDEPDFETMTVEDRQRLLIKAGSKAVLAVEDNKHHTTVQQSRYAGLLQEVPSTPIEIPEPESGESEESDAVHQDEGEEGEPQSTEIPDDDEEGEQDASPDGGEMEGEGEGNRPHTATVTQSKSKAAKQVGRTQPGTQRAKEERTPSNQGATDPQQRPLSSNPSELQRAKEESGEEEGSWKTK